MKLHDNNWVDAAFKALIIGTVCYKLLQSQLEIKLQDLLSLILALFSIWLSVWFYNRAGEISNQFYNRVFEFTKESSITLGKIEAGFFERLDNVKSTLDRFNPQQLEKAEIKLREEEKREETAYANFEDVIKDLMERAKLSEHEKIDMQSQLREAKSKLEVISKSKSQLELQLEFARLRMLMDSLSDRDMNIIKSVAVRLDNDFLEIDFDETSEKVKHILDRLPKYFTERLIALNVIDENKELSENGLWMLHFSTKKYKKV